MTVHKIISNLLESNTFVLEKDGQALVIDAGADLSELKRHFSNGVVVVGILLTHGHFDHAMHVVEYAKTFNCKIYASKFIKEYLCDSKKNYSENGLCVTDFSNFIFFDEDCSFQIGVFNVDCFTTPGHSKCGVSYLIENIIFVGDLIFKRGVGRDDLFGGDRQQLVQSLKKVQSLSFEVLESGHGENSSFNEQKRNLQAFIKFLSRQK